jgi:hypothetical protein
LASRAKSFKPLRQIKVYGTLIQCLSGVYCKGYNVKDMINDEAMSENNKQQWRMSNIVTDTLGIHDIHSSLWN